MKAGHFLMESIFPSGAAGNPDETGAARFIVG